MTELDPMYTLYNDGADQVAIIDNKTEIKKEIILN
jgi:hypothetical protein